MDETIRINAIQKSDWIEILKGFQIETIQQVLEVYNAQGTKLGIICESRDGKSYINGQPKVPYLSLQIAAKTLIKNS